MLLKLENGMILHCYGSDNCLYEDGTDSCIGYNLFNADGSYKDGGEYDYIYDEVLDNHELYEEIMKMEFGHVMGYKIIAETSDCAYEDFNELLEEEFSSKLQLMNLIKKFDNDIIKARIKKSFKNMKY